MTSTPLPHTPSAGSRTRAGALRALIEEAWRRTRRRRRRNALGTGLVALASVAAFVAVAERGSSVTAASLQPASSQSVPAAVASGTVVVTMRGFVHAARTLRTTVGPVHYREAGSFLVTWRVPAAALLPGRTFPSTSALVIGTTSAMYDNDPARSCHGTLAAQRTPLKLRVGPAGSFAPWMVGAPGYGHTLATTGVIASPNPIATATSTSCASGLLASRWRLSVSATHPPYRFSSLKRRRAWYIYNHPGGAFYGKSFTPMPKGGDSEGWEQGWGTAGYLRWLARFSLYRARRTA